MGSVLSTFVQDYNENFSYRIPSHIQMDDSSDEEEQFIIYSRVDVRIVTIDSESDSSWRFVKIPRHGLLEITFALNVFLFGEFLVHIKLWLTVEVEVIMEAREMETKPIMTLVNYSSSQNIRDNNNFMFIWNIC